MELSWLQSLIFGLVSGITELLPVSAPAHEALVMKLFGMADSPLLRLLVHTAVWEALYLNLREPVSRLLQERELSRIPPRRRSRQPDPVFVRDLKLMRSAMLPMVLGFLAAYFLKDVQMDLSRIAVFLLINGVILYIPGHMPTGNKDSRSMTPLDGMLLGLSAAAGIFPGISRIGAVVSAAIGRGAGKEQALRWALLLDLAAMLFVIGFDAYALITTGLGALTVPTIISCVLACAAAFGGAMAGIRVMNFLAFRTGFSGFAYYSWGAALFAFLMYLTI